MLLMNKTGRAAAVFILAFLGIAEVWSGNDPPIICACQATASKVGLLLELTPRAKFSFVSINTNINESSPRQPATKSEVCLSSHSCPSFKGSSSWVLSGKYHTEFWQRPHITTLGNAGGPPDSKRHSSARYGRDAKLTWALPFVYTGTFFICFKTFAQPPSLSFHTTYNDFPLHCARWWPSKTPICLLSFCDVL